jgi:hypothetical protein
LLEILQRQFELIGIQLLGTLTELHSLKLTDDVAQTIILTDKTVALLDDAHILRMLGVELSPHRHNHGLQRFNIVGKSFDNRGHEKTYIVLLGTCGAHSVQSAATQ